MTASRLTEELVTQALEWGRRQGYEQALRDLGGLVDGNPEGCVCTSGCPMPCLHRLGLTEQPCCKQCAPLPPVDDDENPENADA